MKGIIAEIHSRNMIVITKNGDFIKCKKLPNCDIGDEVNIPVKNMQSIYKKISTIAASFIILAMLSSGVYAYYTPYSYVSIDINPSLELYINRFDKVIGVHAFNEEAQKVITASKGIKNKNVDAALEQILDSAAEAGYLKEDVQNSVMIVVSSSNKKEEAALSDKISKTSTAVLSGISSDYDVILEKTKVENYKKAKEQNVSPGKVILADKFKEAKPEIDKEKIKHMPLQQAIKEIEKKDDKDNNNANKDNKPDVVKPKAAIAKPKVNTVKGNVMNVKELIKEKNEELGEKLEKAKDNSKAKDDSKNKEDEKDKKKGEDSESFNQIDQENNKEKDNYQTEKAGQENSPLKEKKDDNSNHDDKEDKNKKQH